MEIHKIKIKLLKDIILSNTFKYVQRYWSVFSSLYIFLNKVTFQFHSMTHFFNLTKFSCRVEYCIKIVQRFS